MSERLSLDELSDVCTPDEVSQAVPISPNAIRTLCKCGVIKAIKTGNPDSRSSRWLIPKTSILRWLEGGAPNA